LAALAYFKAEMVLRLGPSSVMYADQFPDADPGLTRFFQEFGAKSDDTFANRLNRAKPFTRSICAEVHMVKSACCWRGWTSKSPGPERIVFSRAAMDNVSSRLGSRRSDKSVDSSATSLFGAGRRSQKQT
jgi:hypothetical protein